MYAKLKFMHEICWLEIRQQKSPEKLLAKQKSFWLYNSQRKENWKGRICRWQQQYSDFFAGLKNHFNYQNIKFCQEENLLNFWNKKEEQNLSQLKDLRFYQTTFALKIGWIKDLKSHQYFSTLRFLKTRKTKEINWILVNQCNYFFLSSK